MNKTISKASMEAAFERLAKKLGKAEIFCRICIYGGGAMIYAYGLRDADEDVDYRIVSIVDASGAHEPRGTNVLIFTV